MPKPISRSPSEQEVLTETGRGPTRVVGVGDLPSKNPSIGEKGRHRRAARARRAGKQHGAWATGLGSVPVYVRMFTARAAMRRMVTAESVASAAINVLAGRVSGIASVGLNAVELVSDT
jgi:hypothetical protein